MVVPVLKQRRASRFNQVLLSGLALLATLTAAGCFAAGGNQFRQLLLQLAGKSGTALENTLTIRLINEAGSGITESLTLEIDGIQNTYTCSSDQNLCDFVLETCPQAVIAISERRTDAAGLFQGGRNFNGSDESFNFTAGEFECGQVILYRFSENDAEAFVY